METIRNYLDAMFANMPNTPSVIRAREELWQMMEDKYNELIEEGKTENEAVGTVISEFGNLSELAEAIGIEEEVKQQEIEVKAEVEPKVIVSADEAREYMKDKADSAFKRGLGICLIIMSFIGIIIGEMLLPPSIDALSVLFFFGIIAAGVVFIVLSNTVLHKWTFLRSEKFALSMDATKLVIEEKDRFANTASIYKTVGVILCALCWIPAALLDELVHVRFVDDLGGAALFVMVGIGVMLLVYQAQIFEGYSYLLKTTKKETIKATYSPEKQVKKVYSNTAVECIMAVYWPTVTCLYLMLSFGLVGWLWTWIIWPVAAIVNVIINRNAMVEVHEEKTVKLTKETTVEKEIM